MASMEVEAPVSNDSIFMCSEKKDVCQHACCARDHKILWHNSVFLENDSDVELEDDKDSMLANNVTDIVEAYQRRTSNLGSITSELLYAAQSDFEEALTDAIMENFIRDYRLNSDDDDDDDEADDNDDEIMSEDDGSFLEADIINRVWGNCLSSDSSSEDDDDMFLSPPAVRRRLGPICAYDDDNIEDSEDLFLSPPAVRRRLGPICAFDDDNIEDSEDT